MSRAVRLSSLPTTSFVLQSANLCAYSLYMRIFPPSAIATYAICLSLSLFLSNVVTFKMEYFLAHDVNNNFKRNVLNSFKVAFLNLMILTLFQLILLNSFWDSTILRSVFTFLPGFLLSQSLFLLLQPIAISLERITVVIAMGVIKTFFPIATALLIPRQYCNVFNFLALNLLGAILASLYGCIALRSFLPTLRLVTKINMTEHFSRAFQNKYFIGETFFTSLVSALITVFLQISFGSFVLSSYFIAERGISALQQISTDAPRNVFLKRMNQENENPKALKNYLRKLTIFYTVIAVLVVALFLIVGKILISFLLPLQSNQIFAISLILLLRWAVSVVAFPIALAFISSKQQGKFMFFSVLNFISFLVCSYTSWLEGFSLTTWLIIFSISLVFIDFIKMFTYNFSIKRVT